jgi:hypothetical protein
LGNLAFVVPIVRGFARDMDATSAIGRAIIAVALHPARSNRVLAAEINVSEATIRRARRQIRDDAVSDAGGPAGDDAVDAAVERIGMDGRVRKLPVRPPERPLAVSREASPEEEPDERLLCIWCPDPQAPAPRREIVTGYLAGRLGSPMPASCCRAEQVAWSRSRR